MCFLVDFELCCSEAVTQLLKRLVYDHTPLVHTLHPQLSTILPVLFAYIQTLLRMKPRGFLAYFPQ